MSYPIYMPTVGHELAERIDDELARARKKFPQPNLSMTALMEEVGELAKALLDEPRKNVVAEAVQVAVMAIRVATEGDPSYVVHRQRRGLDALGGQP